MRWWSSFVPFYHPHLCPAVLQLIVPELFLCECPSSPNLLKHIKKTVRSFLTNSPSLALSVVSRAGRRRGPRLGVFLLRFPAGLAGCVAAANSWSNPGQSRPSNTGTGRSLMIPTSIGQAPGLVEMVTCRIGTCRVSPCTQVIGRHALAPTFGGNTAVWIRRTALPESNRAW